MSGQVQGVGFRWFSMMCARELSLTGTVRNMANGMVDIHVQGEEKKIDEFLDRLRNGAGWIRVDDMRVKPEAVLPGEKDYIAVG